MEECTPSDLALDFYILCKRRRFVSSSLHTSLIWEAQKLHMLVADAEEEEHESERWDYYRMALRHLHQCAHLLGAEQPRIFIDGFQSLHLQLEDGLTELLNHLEDLPEPIDPQSMH